MSRFKELEKLRKVLALRRPDLLAANTGSQWYSEGKRGYFLITFWNRKIKVSFPNFNITDCETGEGIGEKYESVILHYFLTADATPVKGKWVSLAELPDGGFYRQAYQGYSGNRLSREFGNDIPAFERAARKLGGVPETYGDLSFVFQFLPNLALMAVYWRGDEEFQPSSQILFDASAGHCLPTDMCAFLGSVLVDKLIELK